MRHVKFTCWMLISVLVVACGGTAEPTPAPTTESSAAEVAPASSESVLCTSLNIVYHERPPYVVTIADGIEGLSGSPAKFAFEQLGIPLTWTLTPTNRQLIILQENQGCDCSVGWFKNPERETFAKYTTPIYRDQPQIAITYAGNAILSSGLTVDEALANPELTLGVKDGYSYGVFLDGKIAELSPQTDVTTAENVNMLEKVHRQFNDYFFIAPEEADGLIAISGLPAEDFAYITFSNMPDGENRHIICSMRVQDDLIEQLNGAIAAYVP